MDVHRDFLNFVGFSCVCGDLWLVPSRESLISDMSVSVPVWARTQPANHACRDMSMSALKILCRISHIHTHCVCLFACQPLLVCAVLSF